jgi:hypothetical protein
VALVLTDFILAGIAMLVAVNLWRPLAVTSLLGFHNDDRGHGDVGSLVAPLWLRWPGRELMGL